MFAIINHFSDNYVYNYHIYMLLTQIMTDTDSKFIDVNQLGKNKGNIKNYLLETYNTIPKYYITFGGIGSLDPIIDELTHILKVIIFCDDIHHSRRLAIARVKPYLQSYLNFNTYGYQLNRWTLPNVKNNYYFPHAVRWTLDINKNPINKILVSGMVCDVYPDRIYAINLKHPKIDILKKTTHDDKSVPIGINFFKYLNKYLCCFVDTARDYILAKTFEICGVGSLLLCMNPNLLDIFEQLGFIDGYNYISCTRENIIEKIDYITNPDNRKDIDIIRERGYNLIKEKHTWEYRYKTFLEILDGKFIAKKCFNPKYGTDYYLGF